MNDVRMDATSWPTQKRLPELRRERRFHCHSAFLLESVRRQTFANWTVAYVDPDQLARNGFFYLQTRDHVQCIFCKGIVGYWDPGDQPDIEHRKHFPNCPFITGVATGNVPLSHPADDTGRVYRLLDEYHAFRVTSTRPIVRAPKAAAYERDDAQQGDAGLLAYPQFNTDAARRQTFKRWPNEESATVTIDALVAAGLFYSGISDWVQCFHCGGGLFSWRQGDDPIADHARYYPSCPYIRIKKGEETASRPWDDNIPPPALIRPIGLSDEEAKLLLAHPLAKRLVSMGLSAKSVTGALRQLLQARGTLCGTVSEALQLVFDFEETQRRRGLVSDGGLVEDRELTQVSSSVVENSSRQLPQEAAPDVARYQVLLQEVVELRKRVEDEESRLVCRVCKLRRVAVVFQPCSHLHLCATCARPLDTCPTCSTVIRGTLRPIIG
ncbi:baculoviral IAP repeat-containing protein 7-B-like [Homarus americanus]|nr:baculoviral IAP repeat-containing protein 7-B-like [Homarus americanus]